MPRKKVPAIARPRFCPKCGSIMILRVIDGKKYFVCPRCGYREEAPEDAALMRVREKVRHSPKERLIVVDASAVPPNASLLKGVVVCPKCGHDEAYAWMQQTRAADEPPTRFYRCARCGYTWREYA